MDSILTSVKKSLGIEEAYEHFDADLILHINSILAVLTQIGVGPISGYCITDAGQYWSDFVGKVVTLNFVKTYVYLRVKLLFDPPLTASVTEAMNRNIQELEWRLSVAVSPEQQPAE